MTALSIYILVILGVSCLAALIAVLVNYLKYKRHISKVMNGEEAPSEKRISSPGETALAIFIVLMLLWSGFALVQFSLLHNDIESLTSKVNSLSRDLALDNAGLERKIEESTSLVRTYEFIQRDIDKTDKSVTFDLELALKEYREDTQVTLNYAGQSIQLTKQGECFTGSLTLKLWETVYDCAAAEITSGGVTRVDTLWNSVTGPLWKDYMPQVYASKLPWDVNGKNGKVSIKDDMKFRMLVRDESIEMTKAYVVTEINGKEVARQEINISPADEEVSIPFNVSYDLKSSDTFAIYTLTENNLGFTYKSIMWYYEADGRDLIDLPGELLLDSDGTVLYSE